MAKKNSTASKLPMVFNSVIMINSENLVSLVNSLPKSRMNAGAFESYMKKNFYFGGKFHGDGFIGGSNYSTVVRQLGLYHIINDEYIPRFNSNINDSIADSYLRYWLKLYVVPNPTSQSSWKKNVKSPIFLLKELISFIDKNPSITNIYDIVDKIFGQLLSRNDKGNLPNIINSFSDCIVIDKNNNVTLKSNYKQVMANIDALINNPNRYFDHFGNIQNNYTPKIEKGLPLQQIFYGAPGTGKSNTIKREVDEKGRACIRTTFHPDSDYSTFVGCYKPTMKSQDRIYSVAELINKLKGIKNPYPCQKFGAEYWRSLSTLTSADIENILTTCGFTKTMATEVSKGMAIGQEYLNKDEDGKIIYTFIKQAFLKAYIAAWKKWTMYEDIDRKFVVGGSEKYEITAIGDDSITVEIVKDDDSEHKGDDDKIVITKTDLEDIYNTDNKQNNNEEQNSGIEIKQNNNETEQKINADVNNGIKERIKEIDPKSLDGAWTKIHNSFLIPQFLIIEEINRGNCAQIFGDLFQLLDRQEKGFSEYPIEADEDIRKSLISIDSIDDPSFGITGLQLTKEQKDYIDKMYDKPGSPTQNVAEKICKGKVLVLPPNLYIWATMNTSDQSLFPIDSAFKRRWEWKYVPIGYKNDDWEIEIGGKKYKWVDFQREINDKIYSIDNSEDKLLGDFFVDANRTGKVISSDTLLNKILFYIWNDVCKDDPDQIFRWKDDKDSNKEKSIRFSDFFCEESERNRKLQGLMSFLKVKAIGESEGIIAPATSRATEEPKPGDTLAEKDDGVIR